MKARVYSRKKQKQAKNMSNLELSGLMNQGWRSIVLSCPWSFFGSRRLLDRISAFVGLSETRHRHLPTTRADDMTIWAPRLGHSPHAPAATAPPMQRNLRKALPNCTPELRPTASGKNFKDNTAKPSFPHLLLSAKDGQYHPQTNSTWYKISTKNQPKTKRTKRVFDWPSS